MHYPETLTVQVLAGWRRHVETAAHADSATPVWLGAAIDHALESSECADGQCKAEDRRRR